MKKLNKMNKGFTLIEILVVIGIVAILAAIVLIAINPARQFAQANDSQRTSNVNAILNAVGQYMADNQGALPPSMGSLTAFATTSIASGPGNIDLCTDLIGTYLPSIPADPTVAAGAVTDCSSYDTLYEVAIDNNGRVSVVADGQINPATNDIVVTR